VDCYSGGCGAISPTENDGFFEFARSLPSPKFHEAIKDAELRIAYLCPSSHCQQAAPLRKSNASSGFVALEMPFAPYALSTVKE